MSAEKPEVHDLWNLGRDMYITEIYDGYTTAICLIKDNYGFALEKYDVKFLQKYGGYLSKSKARINDLFEADNTTSTDIIDRNIRKENMRLQAKINKLREALEYYADENNYSHYKSNNEIICDENCGDVAREALNGESE